MQLFFKIGDANDVLILGIKRLRVNQYLTSILVKIYLVFSHKIKKEKFFLKEKLFLPQAIPISKQSEVPFGLPQEEMLHEF